MSKRFRALFCLILIFNLIFSQELKLENITIEHGLSQNSVRCIFQDSKGYMWFGTEDGLNKYDGYNFTVFRSKVDDSTSISDNIISSIFEDYQSNLWVITTTGSLNKFNRETGKFKQYLIGNQLNINGIPFNPIANMYEDSQHNLWAFNRAVYKYLPEKDIFEQIDFNLNAPELSVTFFFEDSDRKFWIGTSNGLYSYNWANAEYKCFKPGNSTTDFNSNAIFSIAEDPGGIFWLGTNRGLFKFDKNTGKFIDNWTVNKSVHIEPVLTDIPSVINSGKYLWMTWQNWNTSTIGVSKLNKVTHEFSVYDFNEEKLLSLSSNVAINLFEDKSGVMWVGTFLRGIFKFNEQKFLTQLKGITIGAFLEDRNGYLWIASSIDGLFRYDSKTDRLVTISSAIPKSHPINTIIEDYKGTLWLGTYDGLFRISSINEETNTANVEQYLQNKVKTITEDLQHRLWVGCEGALCVFYPDTKESIYFYNIAENPNSLTNNSIESTLLDKSTGDLWVATWEGLNRLILPVNQELTTGNVEFVNFKHAANDTNTLTDNNVISLCLDKNGAIWAGTYGGGINRIEFKDEKGKVANTYKITRFTKENGLPNDVVYGIQSDEQANIWISTNEGLSMYSHSSGTFKNYDIKDGLQSNQFFWRANYQSPTGKMYFGGVNGYNAFFPDSIKYNTYLPPVRITTFSIFNKVQLPNTNGSPLQKQMDETEEIAIHYNQSVISFDYVALNFLAGNKNEYAYILEGFDKQWQYVGKQRKATYTNLDPGNYIFRVKASNNDGGWNEEGTSIQLTIIPPFWLTWWFRIIIFLALSLLLLSIFALRIKSIKRRNIMLEKIVEKRTLELKHSNDLLKNQSNVLNETNTLLEERQQQIEEQSEELLAQKEKLIEVNSELQQLNATKDKFFSIIAHDIKNPFNSILGFSELFLANMNKWTDEKKLRVASAIYTSCKGLYELLENLLQWSRSQRGLIEFSPQKIELNSQIEETVKLLKNSAESKNIEIDCDFAEEKIFLHADLNMLDTILRNLLSNAIKFTYPDGAIKIKSERMDSYVLVSVKDSGKGMSMELQNKLFQIGLHQSGSGTNNEKGTGLGLILVNEFITRHGGRIWVESAEEKGSTFYFNLPVSTLTEIKKPI